MEATLLDWMPIIGMLIVGVPLLGLCLYAYLHNRRVDRYEEEQRAAKEAAG